MLKKEDLTIKDSKTEDSKTKTPKLKPSKLWAVNSKTFKAQN